MKALFLNMNCQQCPSLEKSLFCELQDLGLEQIDLNKKTNLFKKGQIVFHEGEKSQGLYCIRSGVIKLTQRGKNGRESITRLAVAGDAIGHKTLFNGEDHPATATILEDAVICYLDKKVVQEIILKEPSAALKLIQFLSRDIGLVEARMASLVRKSAPERIIDLLLFLKESFGVKYSQDETKIDLQLTRDELASLVGTTHETVIRCLSDLRDKGILIQEGKNLLILKVSELEKLSSSLK